MAGQKNHTKWGKLSRGLASFWQTGSQKHSVALEKNSALDVLSASHALWGRYHMLEGDPPPVAFWSFSHSFSLPFVTPPGKQNCCSTKFIESQPKSLETLGKHEYDICVADKMGNAQGNVVGSEPLHTGVVTFFLSGTSVTFHHFNWQIL